MERLFKVGMEPLRKSGSIVEIFNENNKKKLITEISKLDLTKNEQKTGL